MLAYANAEALARTAATGYAHFWSRRRASLWRKGDTSGHTLRVRAIRADCDTDAVLFVVDPDGPACHKGTRTCFGEGTPTAAGTLAELARVVAHRAERAAPEGSYTARLLTRGPDHLLKKVGEEATEFILAARADDEERVREECADLLYHVLVALQQRRVRLVDVLEVLRQRRAER
jgi:phosphoribosyl-ATP pyrophosphohydrolase/phosphoribosyl-AMP cyclohydrolase